jgi:hypothetical protein
VPVPTFRPPPAAGSNQLSDDDPPRLPVRGDEKPALEELYRTHRLRIVRLALLLVDDLPTAEDVTQDAFAGVARSWDRLLTASAAERVRRAATSRPCRRRRPVPMRQSRSVPNIAR